MNDGSLRYKTISGLLYRFAERMLAQTISLVVSVVLARIIAPEDYGAIALITVIITICDVLVTYGFGNALIQKKNTDSIDYSSCFYASLFISIVLYIFLYLSAPILSSYFDINTLSPIIRVMGLRVVIGGCNTIQHAYVSKNMLFRKFFFSTLFGTLISGVLSIFMAYKGFGIWALVSNYMVNTIIDTIILSFTITWRPTLEFSIIRLKALFSMGWKILVAGLVGQLSNEIRSVIIAKKYSSSDLAFYNKGESFPKVIATQINTTISSVLFPVIASKQEDYTAIKGIIRRGIKTISFLMTPLLLGFAAIGETFVSAVLTDKWQPAVPFLRIFCIVFMLKPFFQIGEAFLNGIGRSGLILKYSIITKVVSFGLLIISMIYGPYAIALSALVVELVGTLYITDCFRRFAGYTFKEQLMDLAPIYAISGVMYTAVYLLHFIKMSSISIMMMQIISGGVLYLCVSKIAKVDSLDYVYTLIRKYVSKRHEGVGDQK